MNDVWRNFHWRDDMENESYNVLANWFQEDKTLKNILSLIQIRLVITKTITKNSESSEKLENETWRNQSALLSSSHSLFN